MRDERISFLERLGEGIGLATVMAAIFGWAVVLADDDGFQPHQRPPVTAELPHALAVLNFQGEDRPDIGWAGPFKERADCTRERRWWALRLPPGGGVRLECMRPEPQQAEVPPS